MDYETKNKIGTYLEIAGAASLALVVNLDLPSITSIVPVGLLIYGCGMRDAAIKQAYDYGINVGIMLGRQDERESRKQISSDLSEEIEDGRNLPWVV